MKWRSVVFSIEAPGAILHFQILLGRNAAFCYVGTDEPREFNRLTVCTKARSKESSFKCASSNPLGGDAKTGAQIFAARLLDVIDKTATTTTTTTTKKMKTIQSVAISINIADEESTLRAFAEKTLTKRLLEMLSEDQQ